jgi:hypothetical protein
VHLSALQKDLNGLNQSHSVLDQNRVELDEPVLGQEEHSATSLEQDDPIQWDKALLSSTQGLLTRSGTMGTMTRRKGIRRPDMSQPTRPKDMGHVAHNRGGLEDRYRIKSCK